MVAEQHKSSFVSLSPHCVFLDTPPSIECSVNPLLINAAEMATDLRLRAVTA